jgi:hypothetical protein
LNVPAELKVYLKVALLLIPPLLKTPVSLVTVCETESLLVHVTVVPAATVSVDGVKALPDMFTFGPVGEVPGDVLPPPQPAAANISNSAINTFMAIVEPVFFI